MKFVKKIKYYKTVLPADNIVKALPIVILLGVILSRAWENPNSYIFYCQVYSWECMLLGPILGMIILMTSFLNNMKNINVIVHMQGRKNIFKNFSVFAMFGSIVISLYLNVVLMIINNICFKGKFVINGIGEITKANSMMIELRMCIVIALLLYILGMIFLCIQYWKNSIAYGVLGVMLIVGCEAGFKFYFGRQLFWKYVFPKDTSIYITSAGYAYGFFNLGLLSIFIMCVLYFIINNKDYIGKTEGK